ncbi:MAG: hypothetical protein ACWA6X_11985 [Bauldia sp.]
MKRTLMAATAAFVLLSSPSSGQEVLRGDGGSVRTSLGYGIVVNGDSTLRRYWVTINNDGVPATLPLVGISTYYNDDRASSGYRYTTNLTLSVTEPLAAVQIVFVLFDLWGERVRTLSMIEVTDLVTGDHALTGEWRISSENEVIQYYASIAYVARVRTMDGRVITADPTQVLAEARRLGGTLTAEDVEAPRIDP